MTERVCPGHCLLAAPDPELVSAEALLDTLVVEWPFPASDAFDAVVRDALELGACRVRVNAPHAGTPGLSTLACTLAERFGEVQVCLDEQPSGTDVAELAAAETHVVRAHARDGPVRGPDSDPPRWPPASSDASAGRPGRACFVRRDGVVQPCAGLPVPLGDVRATPLREIVRFSEVLEDLRAGGSSLHGPCASCPGHPACVGCRGAAYAATGDYAASDPTCPRNAERLAEIEVLPVAVAQFVPHAAPMLVVDALESIGDREACASATLRDGHPFLTDDGDVDPVAFVEMAAQAIAAMDGFKMRDRDGGPRGMLLGVRDFTSEGRARVGDRIDITVRKVGRLEAFGVFEVELACAGRHIAGGRITTWSGT